MAQGVVRALWRAERHAGCQGYRGDAQADRHRWPPRDGARHRRRRIRDLAQQLRQPVEQREAIRCADRDLRTRSGRAVLRTGAINAKAPSPNAAKLAANFMLSQECQQFLAKFGRLPTRSDVKDNPPGTVELLRKKQVITTLLTPEEE